MSSFANANLPSEDEEDDDYAPAEARAVKRSSSRPGYRSRPGAASTSEPLEPAAAPKDDNEHDPQRAAKKAKVDDLWRKLNSGSNGAASSSSSASAKKPFSLAQLCKPADKSKQKADAMWMRSLGILPTSAKPKETAQQQPRPQGQQQQHASPSTEPQASTSGHPASPLVAPEAMSVAASALAAARMAGAAGSSSQANKVTVTETRKFAGQDIQVVKQVERGSKEALAAAEKARPATSGLDAMLAAMEKKKKVSVLDKSKMDWQEYKKSDTAVDEELEVYKKSGGKYLDKVDFLKRSELREYERERDQRLGADVRNRGRL